MFSCPIVTQEFTENSSYRLELILPPMRKCTFEQLFLMYLFFDILFPSFEHLRSLACIIPHEVVSDLSVSLSNSFSIVLLECGFLL